MAAILTLTPARADTAEAATAAALRRVAALDPAVNAVLALDPTALDQARALDRSRGTRGPLFGVPVLIKDNIETAGPLPTTAGSLALAANVSDRDAPLVAGLRAAGAVILGKTNLSEWANIRSSASISGWSAVGGLTRNPHALDRTACGSSSGSAARGRRRHGDRGDRHRDRRLDHLPRGDDGHRRAEADRRPRQPVARRADQREPGHAGGPLTVDVTTAARVLTAIAGSDPADSATTQADAHRTDYAAGLRPDALRGARIGVVRWIKGWSPAVSARFDAALAVLKAQGAVLVDVPAFDREGLSDAEHLVLLTEFKAGLDAYLAATPAAGDDAEPRRRHRLRRRPPARARAVRAGHVRRGAGDPGPRRSGVPRGAGDVAQDRARRARRAVRPLRRAGGADRVAGVEDRRGGRRSRRRSAVPAVSPRSPERRT